MQHLLNLDEKYFDLIKAGKKTIELRLFDEKRRNITIGDEIKFTNRKDNTEIFVKVTKIIQTKDFYDLAHSLDIINAGFTSKDEMINSLSKFYTPSDIKKYGVCGIFIKLI